MNTKLQYLIESTGYCSVDSNLVTVNYRGFFYWALLAFALIGLGSLIPVQAETIEVKGVHKWSDYGSAAPGSWDQVVEDIESLTCSGCHLYEGQTPPVCRTGGYYIYNWARYPGYYGYATGWMAVEFNFGDIVRADQVKLHVRGNSLCGTGKFAYHVIDNWHRGTKLQIYLATMTKPPVKHTVYEDEWFWEGWWECPEFSKGQLILEATLDSMETVNPFHKEFSANNITFDEGKTWIYVTLSNPFDFIDTLPTEWEGDTQDRYHSQEKFGLKQFSHWAHEDQHFVMELSLFNIR